MAVHKTKWRAFTLLPLQDWPRQPAHEHESDMNKGKVRGATNALTETWRRDAMIRSVFPTAKWRVVHKVGNSAALAYARHVYRTYATDNPFLHGPVSKGVSDARYMARAYVADKEEPRAYFCKIALHTTPSAFSNRLRGSHKAEARAKWNEGRSNVERIIRRNISKDVPTVILGDWNYKGRPFPKWINGCRVRYVTNGIDKIIFVDSPTRKWQVLSGARWVYKLFSDHDGLTTRARLRVVGERRN